MPKGNAMSFEFPNDEFMEAGLEEPAVWHAITGDEPIIILPDFSTVFEDSENFQIPTGYKGEFGLLSTDYARIQVKDKITYAGRVYKVTAKPRVYAGVYKVEVES